MVYSSHERRTQLKEKIQRGFQDVCDREILTGNPTERLTSMLGKIQLHQSAISSPPLPHRRVQKLVLCIFRPGFLYRAVPQKAP